MQCWNLTSFTPVGLSRSIISGKRQSQLLAGFSMLQATDLRESVWQSWIVVKINWLAAWTRMKS